MRTFDIDEARTHLSRVIDEAARGEAFVIAKAGKPMVKVVPLSLAETRGRRRLGFMAGEIRMPDDFDETGRTDIEKLFG